MKRKADTSQHDVSNIGTTCSSSEDKAIKKPRTTIKGKVKDLQGEQAWPEYFQSLQCAKLFKIFKALNTVLAFVSSRKHLANTFPVVRSSVEGLLKQPLELAKVAELKALLPDLIKFSYIPQNDLRINENSQVHAPPRGARDRSPDFTLASWSTKMQVVEPEEHVLVLEFAENSKGKKNQNNPNAYQLPPSLTPTALKKLVGKRNELFVQAVEELLLATPSSENPVDLLQAASRDHIPVNPSQKSSLTFFDQGKGKGRMIVPASMDRPTIDSVIEEIMQQGWYKDQIIDRRIFDEKMGTIATPNPPLSPTIMKALQDSRKITSLYSHQTTAIDAIAQGKNVIVSTSTASGKSVIYQVPVLRFLEDDPDSTAIFVYPTKALAQDQRAALEQLLWACPGLQHIKVATYDGDTPQEQRRGIRETASIIFTNFDMIHASILPHEELWRKFFKNLKIVAVDELHYYSNLFGSHVAQVLRRFRRVCAAVGNRRSRFISCSATIAKPKQHMQSIFGIEDIEEITEDGAPSGRKDFLVWNPPYVEATAPQLGRQSSLAEATGLMRFLMKRGVRVILFCKIRKVCELAMKSIRADLGAEGRLDILERVMSYRGGYSQQERRRIEHEAFSGNLLGIIATNALELGVDIGVLDAVLMLGFPVGVANFRQQAGRAGRRARDSLAVLVADDLPIDQHYVHNPDELFDKPMDDLIIDLNSKVILEAHLQCAGQEITLSVEDAEYFGPLTKEICETRLTKDKDGWYHTNAKFLPFPAKYIGLRGAQEEKYTVIDVTKQSGGNANIIEEVEISRALFELYEGGVFIHQGLTYVIKEISHDSKVAKVIRADVNWITSPRDFTDIDPSQTYRIREIKDSSQRAFFGRVDITTCVFGFFKIRNKVILDIVDLDTAPWERESTGLWLDVSKPVLDLMHAKGFDPAAAIHAAEHAFLNRFAMAADLKTECKVPEKEYKTTESRRKRPARLIFYDAQGRSGVSAKAFDHVFDILRDAERAVEMCPCTSGCSKCVQSSLCREDNQITSKLGAHLILRSMLGFDIDRDNIPQQYERISAFQTVVEATYVRPVDGTVVESEAASEHLR